MADEKFYYVEDLWGVHVSSYDETNKILEKLKVNLRVGPGHYQGREQIRETLQGTITGLYMQKEDTPQDIAQKNNITLEDAIKIETERTLRDDVLGGDY